MVLENKQIFHLCQALLRQQQQNEAEADQCLSTTLRDLVLECDEVLGLKACCAIGDLLKQNSTLLERLVLWGTQVDEGGMLFIADCMKQNQKLKILHMSHENISIKSQLALLDMLQHHNYYLETLLLRSLFGSDKEIFKRTDFFLKLNTTCLRRLLLNINASREQIFDKLVVHSNNLDYLFHLLKANPTFVEPQQQ